VIQKDAMAEVAKDSAIELVPEDTVKKVEEVVVKEVENKIEGREVTFTCCANWVCSLKISRVPTPSSPPTPKASS